MSIRLFGRSTKLAVVAGIVTFSVLAGAGAGWAYWTSQATSTTSVQAATLSITSTGFAPTTLGNESVTAAGAVSLASTGSITFTNTTTTTSTQTQTLGVTFSRASGDATLAAATTLTVWSVASAASCTAAATPTSPVSGAWSAGVSVSRTLAPGASAVYCVRNTVAAVGVAGGFMAHRLITAGASVESALLQGSSKFGDGVRRNTPVFKELEAAAFDLGKTTRFGAVEAAGRGTSNLRRAPGSAQRVTPGAPWTVTPWRRGQSRMVMVTGAGSETCRIWCRSASASWTHAADRPAPPASITRGASSTMTSFAIRMQPCDAACPSEPTASVPWTA